MTIDPQAQELLDLRALECADRAVAEAGAAIREAVAAKAAA